MSHMIQATPIFAGYIINNQITECASVQKRRSPKIYSHPSQPIQGTTDGLQGKHMVKKQTSVMSFKQRRFISSENIMWSQNL